MWERKVLKDRVYSFFIHCRLRYYLRLLRVREYWRDLYARERPDFHIGEKGRAPIAHSAASGNGNARACRAYLCTDFEALPLVPRWPRGPE